MNLYDVDLLDSFKFLFSTTKFKSELSIEEYQLVSCFTLCILYIVAAPIGHLNKL